MPYTPNMRFSDMAKKQLEFLKAWFCIQVSEVEAAVFGWAKDYVPWDGGHYATFVQTSCEGRGLDVLALSFAKQAGS